MCNRVMRKIILSNEQISNILDMQNKGYSRKRISEILKISESPIKKILSGLNKPYKYIGKKFNRLTVLERVGTAKNGSPIVKCSCECGSIKNYNISNLTAKNATISCGCYAKEINSSKNPWLTEYNAYIGNTIKKRKFSFELTLEEFKNLCLSNCFYCGIAPSSKMDVGKGLKNGIDRIDSNKGYSLSNCVPCCWTCNRMKSNMDIENFLSHIKNILQFMSFKESISYTGLKIIDSKPFSFSANTISPLNEIKDP